MALDWNVPAPDHVFQIQPYLAGKSIESTQREYGLSKIVKLASNENAWGASPAALKAMNSAVSAVHRYPDAGYPLLKEILSARFAVPTSSFCIGNGSNELIDLLPRCIGDVQSTIVAPTFSFFAYKIAAQCSGRRYIESPVDSALRSSPQSILDSVTADTSMVFLSNPNNPTGTCWNEDELIFLAKHLIDRKILFILDAAYEEYHPSVPAHSSDAISLWRRFPNVVVLKTFSKIHGLAAQRIGYAVADPQVIALLDRVRAPFNVNLVAVAGAMAALEDTSHIVETKRRTTESLRDICNFFESYGFAPLIDCGLRRTPTPPAGTNISRTHIDTPPTNFVLVDFKRDPRSGPDLAVEFLKHGIILRPVHNYGLHSHLRITAGTPEENQLLFEAAAHVFGRK